MEKQKRITFIRCFESYSNEIESNRRKQNYTYSNRIILNIIIKMYHYNRIKHRVLYGIELHKLRYLNTIESKLYQS